jgi:hypothetical protein
LDRAVQHGLVDAVVGPIGQRHFVLGEFGLRLLAARAGVPFRRFANHTPFVASLPAAAGGRLQTLIRQFEHTVGANSFMVECLRNSSDPGSPALAVWQNPIEAVVRFESGGVRRALRPDGAGEVVREGRPHSFFLEWDRGTERINVLLEKLTRYAAYYRSASAASADALLVVTPTPHREIVVWRAVSAVMRPEAERGVVRTTVASLVDQYGPYAPIWRQFGSDVRGSWPGDP